MIDDSLVLATFGQMILVDGQSVLAIFEGGKQHKSTVRGRKISDPRPFILLETIRPQALVMVKDIAYRVEEIESCNGLVRAYLREEDDRDSTFSS